MSVFNLDTTLATVFPQNLVYTITRDLINPPPTEQPYTEISITRRIRFRFTDPAAPDISIHIFSLHLYMSPPGEAPGNCRADHAWVQPIATLCGALHIRHYQDLFRHDVFGAVAMGNQIRFFEYEHGLQNVRELVREDRVLRAGVDDGEIERLVRFVREESLGEEMVGVELVNTDICSCDSDSSSNDDDDDDFRANDSATDFVSSDSTGQYGCVPLSEREATTLKTKNIVCRYCLSCPSL